MFIAAIFLGRTNTWCDDSFNRESWDVHRTSNPDELHSLRRSASWVQIAHPASRTGKPTCWRTLSCKGLLQAIKDCATSPAHRSPGRLDFRRHFASAENLSISFGWNSKRRHTRIGWSLPCLTHFRSCAVTLNALATAWRSISSVLRWIVPPSSLELRLWSPEFAIVRQSSVALILPE